MGSFIQFGDSPLNVVFISVYNFLVVGHRASDLYPNIDYYDDI